MAYTTRDKIEKQIGIDEVIQLTDDQNTGAADADIITEAITDADAEIDSYCGTRYTLPFAATPAVVQAKSKDIAIYNLYSRSKRGVPDDIKARYEAAISWLRDVAKGVVALDGVTLVTVNPNTIATTSFTSQARRMTEAGLGDWA